MSILNTNTSLSLRSKGAHHHGVKYPHRWDLNGQDMASQGMITCPSIWVPASEGNRIIERVDVSHQATLPTPVGHGQSHRRRRGRRGRAERRAAADAPMAISYQLQRALVLYEYSPEHGTCPSFGPRGREMADRLRLERDRTWLSLAWLLGCGGLAGWQIG